MAPVRFEDLDRFVFAPPVTLEDLSELQRRVRDLSGPACDVEVYSHDGRVVVVDVRWASGARLRRELHVT